MKEEYIDREALRKAMQFATDDPTCPLHIAATVDQYITEAPAADVVEVKRGRWGSKKCNHKPQRLKNHEKWVTYECSLCGYSNGRKRSNFCPNCGADMREVDHAR